MKSRVIELIVHGGTLTFFGIHTYIVYQSSQRRGTKITAILAVEH